MFGIEPRVGLTTSTLPSEDMFRISKIRMNLKKSSNRLMHSRNRLKIVKKRRRW
jgi:hypothetical protein